MKERGFLGSGASGVDIAALVKAADISYEMARRYCAGLAVPRSEKLGIIAKWLDASPSRLLWGTGSPSADRGALDTELLARCLEVTLGAADLAARKLQPAKLATIATTLYADALKGSPPPTAAVLSRLMLAL